MVGGLTVNASSSAPATFGVTETFLDCLTELAEQPSWWRDVLLRDDLLLAVRRNSLNVYYRGASIFRIDDAGGGRISPKTHVKYLVRQQQALAELQTGKFHIAPTEVGWSDYAGSRTLTDMMRAASDLAGPEKTGLHPLVINAPHLIDVEVSIERVQDQDLDSGTAQDRIDAVTLEERAGQITVVFHEAKHFTNSAIRAKVGTAPPVVEQIRRYRKTIAHHSAALADRYAQVCRNLVRLHEIKTKVRAAEPKSQQLGPIDPIIQAAAAQASPPAIDTDPRLIIFGFDADQKNGALRTYLDNLRTAEPTLHIYAVGNPTGSTGAFRPGKT